MPIAWTPLPYQLDAVKFMLTRACGALFLDPGMRKTSITLAYLKTLFGKGLIKKVLIIAPLRPCYDVWPSEIRKWADFDHLSFQVLHGPGRDARLQTPSQIYIINPEGLEWLLGATKSKVDRSYVNRFTGQSGVSKKTKMTVNVKAFAQLGFDVLIVDELTMFKNTSSNRYKLIKEIIPTFTRRWGLTGSPAANNLLDLFGQCFVLDQGRTLGRFVTHYRKEYFDSDYNGVVWTIKPDGAERIYERLEPLALRLDNSLLAGLPELIAHVIRVDLPDKARRIYDDLERDMITLIESRSVIASNAASVSSKCRQVASGGLYFTPPPVPGQPAKPREVIQLHDAKTEALQELVEGLQGQPLLVAYAFEHDLDRLRAAFPHATFAADVQPAQFSQLSARWNAGKIPLLFGHPQSIGHGLNLQEAGQHVCWYSLLWDGELHDQFNRRVLRSGNTSKHVFIHYLLGRDTIDEMVYGVLQGKEHTQQALFAGLLRLARKEPVLC